MGVVRSGNRCCWRGHICSPIGSKDKLQLEARKGKLFAFPKKKKNTAFFRRYAPIYDKGFVDANLHCYPYGYRGLPLMNPLLP
jgi:hypothetical protein